MSSSGKRGAEPGGLGLAVPPVGPGVCATCHGPARDGPPMCWCCRAVSALLEPVSDGCPLVVPVALCRTGDPLHTVLRGYKDSPVVAGRRHFAARLGAHLSGFLSVHGACIARTSGSTWDCVAVVPSSTRTAGAGGQRRVAAPEHPLRPVVGAVPCLSGLVGIDMRRGAGSADHLVPDPAAFEVDGEVCGRKVLLVDDTWVTGARMRSAAAALGAAGAEVVAMVVAGRAVGALDTSTVPAVARWWRWAEARGSHGGVTSRAPCCFAKCAGASDAHR